MASQEFTVLELDGAHLSMLGASVGKDRLEITRWRSAARPEGVEDTPAAIGAWIGRELREGGFTRSRVVLAARRNDVVLKQLSIPAGPEVTETSIAGAVRLQMVRQLTMPMEGTSVDYTVMPGTQAGQTAILAGAMPADRVQWCRDVCAGAGGKLRRIGLRASGAAALLAEVSQRRAGPVLGIAIGPGSTEFVIVEDGHMVLARATEVARPAQEENQERFIEKLAVEAKRTWMTHRASGNVKELELVGVIGVGDLTRHVAQACGAALGVSGEQVQLPSIARVSTSIPENEFGDAAALAGLLVEGIVNTPRLDFANPRKMPDLAARKRQAVLAAAAVLIIAGGASLVAAKKSLGKLERELETARAEESSLRRKVNEYMLNHARISHIEQWRSARVEWLPHIHKLSEELPSPHDSTADDLSGKMVATTYYDPKGKSSYPGGQWGTRLISNFEINGRVDNRTVAADLRERLLRGKVYTVESVGPDMPDRYSIELQTSLATPIPPQAGENKPGKQVIAKEAGK
jgi:hypothetical protein